MVNRNASAGKSAKTIQNIINLISVILKKAKIDNYLKRDIPKPCEYMMLPKTTNKKGNAYSMEEVKLMMERAKSADNINIQLLLALTCLAGGLDVQSLQPCAGKMSHWEKRKAFSASAAPLCMLMER